MIKVTDLRITKSGKRICYIPNLTIEKGDRLVIVGRNGTGKTTLLRVIAGIEKDYQAKSSIGVASSNRTYVHQSPLLFRGTVAANIEYGMTVRQTSARRSACHKWAQQFGIEHLVRRNVRTLSGGEIRRVALARAFAMEPELLLLDEPFADLDEPSVQLVSDAIETSADATVVITSPLDVGIPTPWSRFDIGT